MRISDWSSDVCSSDLPYLNRTAGGVWRVTYNLRLPRGADGSPGGMVSLDLALDDLVASIESLAYLPGWRALLVAPAGSIAMSSIPEIAQSDTLDDYIAHYARHDLEPAAQAVRVHRPAHFLRSEEHTSELQSLMRISYAVFCLKKN